MPIRDTAAMDASLDNDYGLTRGPNAASSHSLAFFRGDPMTEDGVELDAGDCPGYARITVTAAQWLASADGFKSTVLLTFPSTTGAWADFPTHAAMLDGDTMWDCVPLLEPLAVTSAGPGPRLTFTVFYDDNVLAPELV